MFESEQPIMSSSKPLATPTIYVQCCPVIRKKIREKKRLSCKALSEGNHFERAVSYPPSPTLHHSEKVTLLLEEIKYSDGEQTLQLSNSDGMQHRQKHDNGNMNLNKVCVSFSLLISVPSMAVAVSERMWRKGGSKYSVPSAQLFCHHIATLRTTH